MLIKFHKLLIYWIKIWLGARNLWPFTRWILLLGGSFGASDIHGIRWNNQISVDSNIFFISEGWYYILVQHYFLWFYVIFQLFICFENFKPCLLQIYKHKRYHHHKSVVLLWKLAFKDLLFFLFTVIYTFFDFNITSLHKKTEKQIQILESLTIKRNNPTSIKCPFNFETAMLNTFHQ